ncbi:hypothetical protein ACFO0N_02630 [Halobium salinum]|uniref:Uncharacterized protein n=1 Tax=Halobium salinum TaxID=1364940 RepID=A0ABD5P8K9_9EURY
MGVGLFAAFLSIFYGLYAVGLVRVQNPTAILYVLSSLVGGNLTLVTLVITINQVIISRQLGSPGELREEIENVNEFRERLFDSEDRQVVPVTPSDFLKVVLENVRRDLQRLGGLTADAADDGLREDANRLVTDLTDHVDTVTTLIEESESGTFNTLSVLLTTNYADRIYQLRRLKSSYRESLSDEATAALEEVVAGLQETDVARQYFKTLYIQTELAYVSRVLLYAGVVSETVLLSALLVLSSSSGTTTPEALPPAVAPGLAAVGLLPLSVLFSYVLRLAVVTQRTVAITPFTTPEQEDELDV